ncbi:family 16 glycosylhydrolase [Microvirga flavescens]|uniref:family 16 glycosylhydrolase n=1 Tax=Microvirga flavescens TaxID=2249811 RepID=UPI000DDB248C|nr:family 16 glycosylhydrolase [Microvirga flavescens]
MAINPNNLAGTAVLTFSDEFNAFSYWNGAGGTWDTGYPWAAANGGTNESNGEEQWYINANYAATQSLGTYKVNNGVLNITAAPTPASLKSAVNGYNYTSGMVTTYHSFSQTYGYFEMRAQLPAGQGLWPAFWLLPTDQSWPPEIDVMEVIGSQPNTLNTTVHYGNYQQTGNEITLSGLTTGFHTYGVDWQKDLISWYFDGQLVFQTATPAGMDKPMYMLANLAVGGVWPGSPNASTSFPASLQIDYIRAYAAMPGDIDTDTGTPSELFALKASAKPTKAITGTYDWDTLTGTSARNLLDGKEGGDRMLGSKGDDTYIVENVADRVVEKANQGTDTVKTNLRSYRLPSNVENLTLTGKGDQTAIGNSLNNWIKSNGVGDNTLKGGAGNDILQAGSYADTLTGNSGKDIFLFTKAPVRAGHVTDFTPGVDMLDLRALFKNYQGADPVSDGLLSFTSDGKGNTLVKYKTTPMAKATLVTTLDHVSPTQMHPQDDYFFV